MPVTRIINDCTVDDWKSDPNYVPETSKLEELPKLIEQCSREIRKLILLGEQAKFKDYAELKVGGIDGYSGANTGTLNLYIATRHGDNAVQWLTDVLSEAEKGYPQRALRWAARGLPPDMALKKASVDTEISVNAENRKKRRRRFLNEKQHGTYS